MVARAGSGEQRLPGLALGERAGADEGAEVERGLVELVVLLAVGGPRDTVALVGEGAPGVRVQALGAGGSGAAGPAGTEAGAGLVVSAVRSQAGAATGGWLGSSSS